MGYDRFDDARFYLHCMSDRELIEKNPAGLAKIKRIYRDVLARVQKDDHLRRSSLVNGFVHRRYDEDGEGLTEYRILKGFYTPHEIQELVDEAWITINSPYGCTGRLFTVDIHAKQTPVGLVWIHRKGVDV